MFKKGDIVQIKSLETMKKELKTNECGEPISNGITFVKDMNHLCGRKAKITRILGIEVFLEFDNKSGDLNWTYTTGMIEHCIGTKSGLQVLDVVRLRNGMHCIVLPNSNSNDNLALFTKGHGCVHYLASYTEDLFYKNDSGFFSDERARERDIVAIYNPSDRNNYWTILDMLFTKCEMDIYKWTWERKEPKVKELTASDAAELLKEKFKDYDEIKIVM